MPPWAGPLGTLAALVLGASALIGALSGGHEIASDALRLVDLANRPWVLWQSYAENGLGPLWGSFPPLLPALFGAPVALLTRVVPDFWALRLGVLAWTLLLGLGLFGALTRLERFETRRAVNWLWVFALLPSVWGAASALPQDESYVACFVLALYWAAVRGRWAAVPWLLALTLLAGKYFVLVLLLPVAFASPRPLRNTALWGGALVVLLSTYLGYHYARFGLIPIAGYDLDPAGSISTWALAWQLGLRLPPGLTNALGVLLAGGFGLVLAWRARASGAPLAQTMAALLMVELLVLSTTFPAYVLWGLPLVLISLAHAPTARARLGVAALVVWAGAEYGQNFVRGVALALETDRTPPLTDRGSGVEALAALAESLLGPGFPYGALHVALLAVITASGLLLITLLWPARAGPPRESSRS
jgi:hypothetical protein